MQVNPFQFMFDIVIWLSSLGSELYNQIVVIDRSILGDLSMWEYVNTPLGLAFVIGALIIAMLVSIFI